MYVLEASEENRRAVQVIRKTYGGKRRLPSSKSERVQLRKFLSSSEYVPPYRNYLNCGFLRPRGYGVSLVCI